MPAKRERRLFFEVDEPGSELEGARLLPLDLIDPNPAQSRQVFDEAALQELAASIAAHGVLQPIVVRPVGDRYQIVAGERRSRAARMADLVDIPAIIREMSDEQAAYVTAVENLQREDLDVEDEARQYQTLLDLTGLSQRALAAQLGINHVYIARRVKLLARPDLIQAYRDGQRGLMESVALVDSPAAPTVSPRNSSGDADDGEHTPSEHVVMDSPNVERATLDHRTGAVRGGDLQRTPWRERPLASFMTWVARVDVTTVPPAERVAARQQIAEAREWLARLEMQLEELGGGPVE